MCVVSNIYDYGRQTWPQPSAPPVQPWTWPYPFTPVPAPKVPTREEWDAFLELVEKALKFDELTGQPDCEDPKKGEWMADIERRLAELEAK